MVSLSEVRTHNASLRSLAPGLVAVFVGGTSGIGLSTAREFVRNTNAPHIYLIGRNEAEAAKITTEFQSLNADSKTSFIKSDVSLLKNVDQACREIAQKEKKVNLLFMTMGYFTMNGERAETEEGLDRKLALHYYSRMRFVQNLAPLLTAAAESEDQRRSLSRVVSVLDPKSGRSANLDFSDLSLKKKFGLRTGAAHATGMNNYALEHMAQIYPQVSFVHSYPSAVLTNAGREMGHYMNMTINIMSKVMKPFMVDLTESGERHLYAATAPQFVPRAKSGNGNAHGVARGSDEVLGSGSYALNWDEEVLGKSKNASRLRGEGAVEKVWKHTEEVFGKIFGPEGKY
jgi:NAD(P)-dependent dehydrogenase (short-subunit alcohol dehydrogenase family)